MWGLPQAIRDLTAALYRAVAVVTANSFAIRLSTSATLQLAESNRQLLAAVHRLLERLSNLPDWTHFPPHHIGDR